MKSKHTNTIDKLDIIAMWEELVIAEDRDIDKVQINWSLDYRVTPYGVDINPRLDNFTVFSDGNIVELEGVYENRFVRGPEKAESDFEIGVEWIEIDFKNKRIEITI